MSLILLYTNGNIVQIRPSAPFEAFCRSIGRLECFSLLKIIVGFVYEHQFLSTGLFSLCETLSNFIRYLVLRQW